MLPFLSNVLATDLIPAQIYVVCNVEISCISYTIPLRNFVVLTRSVS